MANLKEQELLARIDKEKVRRLVKEFLAKKAAEPRVTDLSPPPRYDKIFWDAMEVFDRLDHEG